MQMEIMRCHFLFTISSVLALGLFPEIAKPDVFNMPSGETSLLFVNVGDAGNVADPTTGFGAVGHVYQIGKYDVTNAQYVQFLNSKATVADPYGLWNSLMSTEGIGGIDRSGSGPYSYSAKLGYENQPVTFETWYDTLRFTNWLSNGQGNGDTESGAYTLLGGSATPSNSATITRSSDAKFFLPSENEWYKAAYYKSSGTNAGYWTYPTASSLPPQWELSTAAGPNSGANAANFWSQTYGFSLTGSATFDSSVDYLTDVGAYPDSLSAYGTLDQGGNVYQWNEAAIFSDGSQRGVRGGSLGETTDSMAASYRNLGSAASVPTGIGFRVASIAVPEPTSLALVIVSGLVLASFTRHFRHSQ
jgi:formylglycine-generating enzyme required for sulfatase activity